jgi:cleavage and polyadenylation specificity factor subunit 1
VKPRLLKLYTANTTEIDTYGEQNLELNLNLRRSFKWIFFIANVQSPIIGADFLFHYGLLIDLKSHRLINTVTSLKTDGEVYHTSEFGISTVSKTLHYSELLSRFIDVITTSVLQYSITSSPLDLQ